MKSVPLIVDVKVLIDWQSPRFLDIKAYETLSINIVDVKVLIDWQSPMLEVLLWFWGISGSSQGHWGSRIKNKYIYQTNVIHIVDLYLHF